MSKLKILIIWTIYVFSVNFCLSSRKKKRWRDKYECCHHRAPHLSLVLDCSSICLWEGTGHQAHILVGHLQRQLCSSLPAPSNPDVTHWLGTFSRKQFHEVFSLPPQSFKLTCAQLYSDLRQFLVCVSLGSLNLQYSTVLPQTKVSPTNCNSHHSR